jgi:DNA adenine methylase
MAAEIVVQHALFDELPSKEVVVNVASVPHRSPFRYPGGKTWLVPRIRRWLGAQAERPALLVEPFAGGGTVALTAVFEGLAERVLMVERDPNVAAVWQTILHSDSCWLCERILEFSLSPESVARVLDTAPRSTRERAFQTVLRNRVNHGGILAPGSGRLKVGENGRGMASRWYPQTLATRIRAIVQVADRITFVESDGLAVLKEHRSTENTVFFIDPPYTAEGKRAGARLYAFNELDHDALFRCTAELQGDFLMTYDNTESVRAWATKHGFLARPIPMKNTHHATLSELILSRNLDWA